MVKSYQRPRHQLAEKTRTEPSLEQRRRYRAEIAEVNPALAEALRANAFTAKHHVTALELDDKFMQGINSNTRILELGAGSGRLAALFMKRKSRPQYTIFDRKYLDEGRNSYPLNRGIRRLVSKGVVKMQGGHFYDFDFQGQTFHHILLPASFFPRRQDSTTEEYSRDRIELVRKFLGMVEVGGTIRASPFNLLPNVRLERYKELHAFLADEQRKGNISFKTTEVDSPPQIAIGRGYGQGKLYGLVITKLR